VHTSLLPVPIMSQINPAHASRPIYLKFIWILSSHLRLGHPNVLFPSSFLIKTLCAPLLYMCHIRHPSHSSWFDHPNCDKEYISQTSRKETLTNYQTADTGVVVRNVYRTLVKLTITVRVNYMSRILTLYLSDNRTIALRLHVQL
jgi:hypothetical protein